ncbi:subtilisin-like protease SBT4.14 isoform X2 [Cicer arietinum]|uniref:Subtilisin-like protease SBT4.14 isoform X2 n=1 Tax=Cicer arietinum TaxID=3827 RepID=A0A1S2YW92_CICAR|nr:subtilisin-like protease SBT4.14 isoform X2 [Cicer arietinum]
MSMLIMYFQKLTNTYSLLWLPLLLILLSSVSVNGVEQKDFYIVFLGTHSVSREGAVETHLNILSTVKQSHHEAKESIVYSYTKSFNAFAAKLSEDEANKLSAMNEVLSVFLNQYRKLHTTRSWDFIGLPLTAKRKLKLESDTIVALLDTGITPEFHSFHSFKDDGFGPPPVKWRGTCDKYVNFSGCNNKIIGAKYFKLDGRSDPSDILSPIDVGGGHGTHTASTAAGNLVPNASLFGLAKGTARGAVPSARLAIYKVCWKQDGCADMDILAAFEAAIHDGVNVISVSLGGENANYLQDTLAIGAFHAMRKGIITVASAGNDGPTMATVVNNAPWIVTVAASGIDRDFHSTIELGNRKNVSGLGISTFSPKQKQYPLVNGVDAARDASSKENAKFCLEDSLEPKKVKGKIVYCRFKTWSTEAVVKAIGGIGTIVEYDQFLDVAEIFMAPATFVNKSTGQIITNYIQTTRSPSAVIDKSHEVKIPAPFVASFSSRGPNPGSQHVLKPDVTAPGISILASYTLRTSITGLEGDTQFSEFTLMSGTSMSCPHVSGVAAYVKSFHPDWSPAAIRSAIITTAKPMSQKFNKEAEFAFGAGQVNPTRAVNPGLVYDMDDFAYIQFLCHEGYNGSTLSVLIGSPINCTSLLPGIGHDAINYPSMQLSVKSNTETTIGVFRRRVTNVGPGPTIYNSTIKSPKGVEITVKPTSLIFSHTLQKRSFKVSVKAKSMSSMQIVSGSLIWRSPRYIVRSPIVIYSP